MQTVLAVNVVGTSVLGILAALFILGAFYMALLKPEPDFRVVWVLAVIGIVLIIIAYFVSTGDPSVGLDKIL